MRRRNQKWTHVQLFAICTRNNRNRRLAARHYIIGARNRRELHCTDCDEKLTTTKKRAWIFDCDSSSCSFLSQIFEFASYDKRKRYLANNANNAISLQYKNSWTDRNALLWRIVCVCLSRRLSGTPMQANANADGSRRATFCNTDEHQSDHQQEQLAQQPIILLLLESKLSERKQEIANSDAKFHSPFLALVRATSGATKKRPRARPHF